MLYSDENDGFWPYRELARKLETREAEKAGHPNADGTRYVQERGTIHLYDPAARERLDEEIHGRYFPAVLKGLRGSSLRVHDKVGALSQIKDKFYPVATRELVFLLHKPPAPPAGPGSPPWFLRGKIECSLERCMLYSDLILALPRDIDLEPVLELMGDARLQGIPPSLSIEYRLSEDQIFVLSISSGRSVPSMEWYLTESARKHVAIVGAVERAATRWSDRELFF